MRKRWPRKAKKWARKNGVTLLEVHGRRITYMRQYRPFWPGDRR